jgi:hypothetical protein
MGKVTEEMRVIWNRLIRVLAGVVACVGIFCGTASAQTILYDNLPISLPPPPDPPGDVTSGALNNFFSSMVGNNAITSLVAEDISVRNGHMPGNAARLITQFDFIVTNTYIPDAGATETGVTFRPRVRMWTSNPLGDRPTELLQTGMGQDAVFDLPAVTLPAPAPGSDYSSALLSLDLTSFGGVSFPGDTPNIWIGLVFDDMDGTLAPAGASNAERLERMNNIGMYINNQISPGSSADQLWGTIRGDSFAVDNPEGGLFNSDNLEVDFPLNLAYRVTLLTIPEPGAGALAVTAILPLTGVMLRRRRCRTNK